MNVCFETFGCRLNRAEALEEEAKYLAQGHKRVEDHASADLIVVRGCSVTARAQRDCEKLIEHLRRKYPAKKLIVTGCLENRTSTTTSTSTSTPTPVPTRTARAYLKVQDGCNGKCSFCIVPKFRGKSAAEDFVTVLDKAKRFIDAGYHEIVVTGCNLSLYASQGKRLPELLGSLADLSADCRIRLGSLEPGPCGLEVVRVMSEKANLCRFLHIPVQSGSNLILGAMRRPYTVKDVETLVNDATTRLPGLGLGCDLIAGFPGETELDHQASVGLLRRLPFNHAHVFPFSARPGTFAETLPCQLPREIKSARATELSDLVASARRRFARRFLNRIADVLIEDETKRTGWTSEYLWCEVSGLPARETRKRIVRVRITEAIDGQLRGAVAHGR